MNIDRIVVNPLIHFGKPCIAGTRITVQSVLELLMVAREQERIFVSRDGDFGNPVFVKGPGAGVLYPRILPSTQRAVHRELEKVLNAYSEEELKQAFVVIEPGGHRFRKVRGK